MHFRRIHAGAALAVAAFALPIRSQTVLVSGSVKNPAGQILSGASVRLLASGLSGTTGGDGRFHLQGASAVKLSSRGERTALIPDLDRGHLVSGKSILRVDGRIANHDRPPSFRTGLAKAGAASWVDTLEVRLAGYVRKTLAVRTGADWGKPTCRSRRKSHGAPMTIPIWNTCIGTCSMRTIPACWRAMPREPRPGKPCATSSTSVTRRAAPTVTTCPPVPACLGRPPRLPAGQARSGDRLRARRPERVLLDPPDPAGLPGPHPRGSGRRHLSDDGGARGADHRPRGAGGDEGRGRSREGSMVHSRGASLTHQDTRRIPDFQPVRGGPFGRDWEKNRFPIPFGLVRVGFPADHFR